MKFTLSPWRPLEQEWVRVSQCYYWKGWLHCLSSGFADLAPWTIAKHKASSPWPLPTHLLGVGDDLFVPQLSWKK